MTAGRDAELRAIDEEIARLRGWFTTDYGSWTPRAGDLCGYVMVDQFPEWSEHEAPPFSREWALAGPLLLELPCPDLFQDGDRWVCFYDLPGRETEATGGEGVGPCEAIARAWLSWRKART